MTFVRFDENDTQISAAERLIELDQSNTQDPDYSDDLSSSSSSESVSEPAKPKRRSLRKRGKPRKISLSVKIGTNIATYQLAPYPQTNIAAYASTPNHDEPEPTTYEAAIHGPEANCWRVLWVV
jgi:hypothetical protein